LLKLGQHPVNGGQANVGAFLHHQAVNIFGRHVALLARMEIRQDFQSGRSGFEASVFEVVDVGHGGFAVRPDACANGPRR
jgi:hypothetical protein